MQTLKYPIQGNRRAKEVQVIKREVKVFQFILFSENIMMSNQKKCNHNNHVYTYLIFYVWLFIYQWAYFNVIFNEFYYHSEQGHSFQFQNEFPFPSNSGDLVMLNAYYVFCLLICTDFPCYIVALSLGVMCVILLLAITGLRSICEYWTYTVLMRAMSQSEK